MCECSFAIIASLEQLALSVFEQLVGAVMPDSFELSEAPDAGGHNTMRSNTAWQKLEVVLAKRDGKNGCAWSRWTFPSRLH